ncbi:MAG: 23S rRNA (adenine(2503)-C(2))-methyltransferase RlmN, partial [Chthoniobacteraceae bacterium]
MLSPHTDPCSLADLSALELAVWMEARGWKASHALRVLRRLYAGAADAVGSHVRMPAGLMEQMRTTFCVEVASLARRQVSDDGTAKLLLRLGDGRTVESVLMPDFHPDRAAGCISSQVGCAMGCDFCATTQTGFERNLSPGEIEEQFIRLRREARAVGRT